MSIKNALRKVAQTFLSVRIDGTDKNVCATFQFKNEVVRGVLGREANCPQTLRLENRRRGL